MSSFSLVSLVEADLPTHASISIREVLPLKEQAPAANGSQIDGFDRLTRWVQRRLGRSETVMRAIPAAPPPRLERDLFEGVPAELRAGATPEQIAQAQAAVDQASAALELARKPFTAHDLKQAENAVAAAEEQWKLARSPYTREDLDVARASVAQAEANLDLARSQLAETEIVAPIDGVVAERLLSLGGLVAPQLPILTIVSSDLEIALSVEEARAREVSLGQPISLTVAAYPDASFAGTVSNIAPTIDTRSRTFAVKASPEDPQSRLRAGMLAKISLSLAEDRDMLLVPERAVVRRGAEKIVFAVVDGRAQMRRVESGASDGQSVQILSGLKVGERVAVGNADLVDGDAVVAEGT